MSHPVLHGYSEFLKDLKSRILQAQRRAILSVNRELVLLYWDIGRDILKRQSELGWGAQVIDRLARDLRRELPKLRGFSQRNLKYMRAFAGAYPDKEFVQQPAAQIPWGHNVRILDYVKDPAERAWYIRKTIEEGWSRAEYREKSLQIDCKGEGITHAKARAQVMPRVRK